MIRAAGGAGELAGDGTEICLLLEGTYPYVRGGVSTWVHALIRGLPDYRFSCVFLGSHREDYGEIAYDLPDNVIHLESHFLFDDQSRPHPVRSNFGAEARKQIAAAHEQGCTSLLSLGNYLDPSSVLSERGFLYSKEAWEYITDCYERNSTDPSFVDYFWTVRNQHAPLWQLARIARELPLAHVYHSVSTGYAGFLGALAAKTHERPFVLTEHGIYTKERRIDLINADWISDNRNVFQRDPTEVSYLRELWVRFFETLGSLAYGQASRIVSLYEEARHHQIADGADPERTRIIPNGVPIERLARLRRPESAKVPKVVALIGRVVTIKDIKTFIRAVHLLRDQIPEVEGWIVGPQEEDPDYVRECRELAADLSLGHHLRFPGFVRLHELLPHVGIVGLTSVSEALPLIVLEGFAAGLPAVTTAVGACPELIRGSNDEDASLGEAGRLVGLANPAEFASACRALLEDPEAYRCARSAAIARVERYYRREQMLGALRSTYEEVHA